MLFTNQLITDEKVIFGYKFEDLKPLLDLIPRIKATEDFSVSPIVQEFPKLAYESKIMIDFDWPEWDEGTKIVENSNFDYSTLDRVSLCKLITVVVQSESYLHNGLIDYFNDGTILNLLENLQKKI